MDPMGLNSKINLPPPPQKTNMTIAGTSTKMNESIYTFPIYLKSMGGSFPAMSHVIFDRFFFQVFRGIMFQFPKKCLGG